MEAPERLAHRVAADRVLGRERDLLREERADRVLAVADAADEVVGNLRGLPRWNLDATLAKDFKITERVGLQFTMQFTNLFNHFQPNDPRDNIHSAKSGTLLHGAARRPRRDRSR